MPSAYAGGEYDITDPSGTYPMGGDLVFKTYVGAALPVEMLSFTGLAKKENVFLNWITASEINSDYFDVERSRDGFDFEKIGSVNGAGNSNSLLNYSFTDESPLVGISYYRLKQTDYDGAFEYFGPVAIDINSEFSIKVFPNPTDNIISIELSQDAELPATVSFKDIIGNEVRKFTMNDIKQNEDISDLAPGIYFLSLKTHTNCQNIKLIKQ